MMWFHFKFLMQSRLSFMTLQERQVAWLVKEYGNSQFVPMSALLAHLQQEIQV